MRGSGGELGFLRSRRVTDRWATVMLVPNQNYMPKSISGNF